MTKLSFWSLALLTGVGCTVAACSSSDTTPAGGAGAAGEAGAANAGEGGASGAGENYPEGGAAGEGSTLYSRLGGHAGIAKAINNIVLAEVGDADIASFFAPNLNDPNHKPQVGDIEECLTAQLGAAAEGPGEVYPIITSGGHLCRSMADAHADLHIGSGTFDNFVNIAGGELKKLGVADDDIATVASVLVGTKGEIVDPAAPTNGPCVSPACEIGAGGAGGAGGSN